MRTSPWAMNIFPAHQPQVAQGLACLARPHIYSPNLYTRKEGTRPGGVGVSDLKE